MALSAKELVDSVTIKYDTPIVIVLIKCLKEQFERGRTKYVLTSEQAECVTIFDEEYIRSLGYNFERSCELYDDSDDDEENDTIISIPDKLVSDKIEETIKSGAKRQRTS